MSLRALKENDFNAQQRSGLKVKLDIIDIQMLVKAMLLK